MIVERKTSYGVRVHLGGGRYEWVGSFPFDGVYELADGRSVRGKRGAKEAAAEAERRTKTTRFRPRSVETCDSFAGRWPDDYPIVKQGPTRGRRKSAKTLATYRNELQPFIERFKGTPLAALDRQDARRFALDHPRSAVVVRGMLGDAVEDGLIQANPFADLRLEQSSGRAKYEPITQAELQLLADAARVEHGAKYGPLFRSYILAAGYIGFRLTEGLNLEWRDVDFRSSEITLRVTKFDKPRTVWLPDEAADALRAIPRRVGADHVFSGKRGGPLTKGNHQALWTPVRSSWWAKLSDERRTELVDFDFHSLRHHCAHWIYIVLGKGSELAAFQLGHSDPSLIEKRYGHPFSGALDRLKRDAGRPQVVSIQDARQTHAAEGSA